MIIGVESPDSTSTHWDDEPKFDKYILIRPIYKYILVRPIYKYIIPGLSHLHGRRD